MEQQAQQHTGKQGRFRKVVTTAVLAGTLAMSAVAWAAVDRRMDINNNSSYTLTELYAMRSDLPITSQVDRLGLGVVNPHEGVKINFDDGSGYCRYNLKSGHIL